MAGIERFGLVLLAIVGGILAVVFCRSAWRGLQLHAWEKVSARVIRAWGETTQNMDQGQDHTAMVEYVYQFGGREWRGRSAVSMPGASRAQVDGMAATYPLGRVIDVEVYRKSPGESRMRRSESAMAVIGTLFGLGMLAFAIAMIGSD